MDKILEILNNSKTSSDPIKEEVSILSREFMLFRIDELTFDDKAPRKEGFENVLSALRIEGINIIYLILGDKKGVSFYLGIAKNKRYNQELELDVDDIAKRILKPSIEGNFRGSKISKVENKTQIIEKLDSLNRVYEIDGIPAINEEKEDFQGVDRLVDVMVGDEFGLMILSNPLSEWEIKEIENNIYETYNLLYPYSKHSIQETKSTTETDGKSEGSSHSETIGSSDTKGNSTSQNNSTTDGTSHTTGKSNSTTKGSSKSEADSYGNSKSITKGESNSEGESTSNAFSQGKSESATNGDSKTTGSSNSFSKNKSTTKSASKTSDSSSTSESGTQGSTDTKGFNKSNSTNFSTTKGTNESNTYTTTTNSNKTKTTSETTGSNENHTLTYTTNNSITTGTNSSDTTNHSTSTGYTKTENYSHTENNSTTKGVNKNTNYSLAKSTGENKSIEYTNKFINEWLEYIDEILLNRLKYGKNKGLFNMGVYIFAKQKGTLTKLSNTIKALFSGVKENKAPLKSKEISKQTLKYIQKFQLPYYKNQIDIFFKHKNTIHSKYNNLNWCSTNELSVIGGLPQKEVIGLSLKEEVEFGLNIKETDNKLLLGNLVKSGLVTDIEVNLDKDSLNKHIFITGVTGSGKTTTSQRILYSSNTPFLVIEPAKTEYRVLSKIDKTILIFTLGDDKIAPFRLNPFEFLPNENITSRVDLIKANIEASFDMEAAIPQLIETALYRCYEEYGWDISTNENYKFNNPFDDGVYAFPTLTDLIKQVEIVVNEQGFDERLKNDYIGSIKARLQGLLVGSKGVMLNTPRSIDFTQLLEKNVVLELEEIKNPAQKSLIMGFVLINLNEAIKQKYKEYKKQNKEFKHITLIEEAHRLLSKYEAGDNPNKKLGVETFADMLAEVRKYGESLIIADQIPNKLTPEVLKNTNTKIVHRLFASDDKEAIGNTMALIDEQKEFLSNLEVGKAIVFSSNFDKPLQVQIKELNNISTTKSEIIDDEEINWRVMKFYQANYKKGIIQGLEIFDEMPDIGVIKNFIKYKLIDKYKELFTTYNFRFDFKKFIIENRIDIEKLAQFLDEAIYQNNKKSDIINFFQNVLEGKTTISLEEKAKLKIRN